MLLLEQSDSKNQTQNDHSGQSEKTQTIQGTNQNSKQKYVGDAKR